MDETSRNCSAVPVTNCGHPVWCSEDILISFFTDVSLQVAMDSYHLPDSHSTPPALPELRLVLLGRKGAGKSAAGNTILGGVGGFESGKPTEECVKRRADVAGRRLTVVDTPGWEWYYPLNGTPNWVKRETSRSVSLCPPGPHAVLLVVRACASVTEDYIGEMEDHLGPLGMGVWEHAVLLFTRGDELGLVSMEQRILSSGPALQRLLQNCGNRYHVMDSRSKGDGTQVKELIKKLEEMVGRRQGGCSYLVMDNEILLGLEADGKRRARERRKKQRQMEEQMQRASIKAALMSEDPEGSQLDAHQSFSKAPRRLPEVRLVLLGERETGKSSAGNGILGETVFFQVGAVTEECTRREAEVATRLVTVVDTPGWESGVSGATPERVKREIVSSVALCPPGPHALLLTLRVDTLVKAGHVKEHLELLGEGVWRHTILLFTHGDQLREGVDIEQHIQDGGRDLQWLLEKCRGRYHVISSVDKSGIHGDSCKVTDLLQEVEKMAAMNRCEAFSGLSQEVRHLSRQRNKNFSQRLKEIGDKVIRQETELKNMREREMKSIRWFFDRKKKVKSTEKANIEREEEEDRRNGERKNDIREVEERMGWLTEDKEREVQDLTIEKERIHLALNHSRREQDKAMLNLELKEREIEELKERVEEQQMRLLDLERAVLEYENERKKREDVVEVRQQEWMSEVKKLKGNIEQQKKDEAEWMEKVDCLEREMEETKRQHDNILEREAGEKKREMAEMEENMNIKLFEKEEEIEDLREKVSEEMQAALTNAKQLERNLERKVAEMKSQHKKEMERKTQEKEIEIRGMKLQHQEEMATQISQIENRMEMMTVQHQKEMDQKLKDTAEDLEKIQQQHGSEIRDMQQEKQRQTAELKRQFAKETEQQVQAGKKKIEDLEQRFLIQMEAKMQEKEEKENIYLNLIKDVKQKMDDKEKELQGFKLQHQEEMQAKIKEMKRLREEIKAELQEEMERKVKENERDVERVQQGRRDKIRDIEQERQTEVKELQQQFAEENEKQLKERQNMLEENHAAQIKETALKIEPEKESMTKNHEGYILQKMEQRDRLIQELKHQHFNEINDKMQQHDKEKEKIRMNLYEEKEQRLEEREKELERMKLSVKELKEMLQQKEDKENKHLDYKENMEQMLVERAKEVQMIKERLHEAEERERGHLNCSEEMEQKLEEKERLIEKLRECIKDMNETLQRIEGEREEIILKHKREMEKQLQDRKREMEEVKLELLKARDERKEAEMMEKSQGEAEELHQLRQRDRENEKELLRLRLVIEQTKSELKELTGKMEKEMASMIEEYEREIARRNEGAESIARERDRLEEESRQRLSEVTEKWQESRRRVDLLQEQNREMRKEADDVVLECEELKKTSEGEVRKHLEGYERQAKSVEAEIRSILKERDVEVRLLTEANVKLKAEIVRMTERGGEAGRRPKERQFRSEDQEIGEEFSKRDKALTGNEELDAKEEELVEKELESLFTALEGKQIELDHHGPDLQKRDHGKELEDREEDLKNEEEELANWKSELRRRDVQVNSRAPQSDETARDSALLREELHGEEDKLKAPFRKPSKWEGSLAEREEELLQREKRSHENENERMDESHLMTQEVQSKEEGEKGRDRDRDRRGIAKERADKRMKTALSSAESNNHKLKATEAAAGRDRMRETKESEDLEEAEVSHDFKFLSASQGSKDAESAGSELRVMVLGEPWSSRSPAGVTVLGGEAPEHDGRSFRHWRGRVEGRRLALVEPLGLRWRDGPDAADAMQKKSILDSLSWCRPGPHGVLLLVPAFLTCTRKYRSAVEEHVRLLGEGIWQRTLVLFTWGEVLGESAEQHVRRNGELMRLVERCGGGFHVVTSRKSNVMIEGVFQKMRDMIGFEQRVNL